MLSPLPNAALRRAYTPCRVGEAAEADGITGDFYECGVRYSDSFDAKLDDAVAWVIGMLRRCIGNALEPDYANHAELALDHADLRAAVVSLNQRDREFVALRYGVDRAWANQRSGPAR